MKDFDGKAAVITGGSSGFGLAIARECAKRHVSIVLADIDGDRLQTAAQQLAADGADVLPVQMDVTSLTDMQMLGKKALEKHRTVDLLFNNAGITVPGTVWMLSMNDWEWAMKTNVWGAIHGLKVFIPMMLEQGNDGHIVNTASIAGLVSVPGMSAYQTSKFAVVGLSESTYLDIQSITHKIKMSIFCPGFIKTGLDDSELHRPEQFKNSADQPADEREAMTKGLAAVHAVIQGGTSIDDVGEIIFTAIEDETFYILVHPQFNPLITLRATNALDGLGPSIDTLKQYQL
jgi:NADP-dependent 3-hydroxy acid dehydrogenase YdfG